MQCFIFLIRLSFIIVSFILCSCLPDEKKSNDKGFVELSGIIYYIDKLYNKNGFLESDALATKKAVRFAKIEIFDKNSELITSTYSSDLGLIQVSLPQSINTFNLKVHAEAQLKSGSIVSVIDQFSNQIHWQSGSQSLIDKSSAINIDFTVSPEISGAFNVLDVVSMGMQFIETYEVDSSNILNVIWAKDDAYSTHYCPQSSALNCLQGSGIYLSGSNDHDSDIFDDDRVWHEFAHYILDRFSRDDSPGGCHILKDNGQDLRISWSEGWSNFFPLVVKQWIEATNDLPESTLSSIGVPIATLIDLGGEGGSLFLDIADLQNNVYLYSSNEVAITKVLWSLYNSYGFGPIWEVVSSLSKLDNETFNLDRFWMNWLSIHAPNARERKELEAIYSEREISYFQDLYEPDEESLREFDLGDIESHTLYLNSGDLDIDRVAFFAQKDVTYEIKTQNLKNGADTLITLFYSNNEPVFTDGNALENDDYKKNYESYDPICEQTTVKNAIDALASRLEFTSDVDGFYILQVKSSPRPYSSASLYGSYELVINALNSDIAGK